MNTDELLSPIARELRSVEARLQERIESRADLVSTVAAYVLGSGGKRVRPALLLLSAKLCGYADGARDVLLAAVAEYMHVATLIHDDIIDHAETRRGLPSAQSKWGPDLSVLVGDFLYSRSIQMLVEDGDFAVLKAFADATVSMAEGEVLQLQMRRKLDMTDEEYLRIITCKTAALFSAACRAGALVAAAPAAQVEALAAFGLNVGIAFQMVDDALDYVAHADRLGKPVASDFKEGKVTYPVIHTFRHGAPEDRVRMAVLAAREALDPADVADLRALIERYGAVKATMDRARGYLEAARGNLAPFPDSPARRSLMQMVDFVAVRDW